MAFNTVLADRVRNYLINYPELRIEEKKMFRGLAFIVNDKMCINVSGDNLMCRFDPLIHDEIAAKKGFQPMIMKEKVYKEYCYVSSEVVENDDDFIFWIKLCLEFNWEAKSSKKPL